MLWAQNEGLGDHLQEAYPKGNKQADKLFCWACATWIGNRGSNLKDHVLGKSVLMPSGTRQRQRGNHARKVSLMPQKEEGKAVTTETCQPTFPPSIIVNIGKEALNPSIAASPPPSKKLKVSNPLQDMLRKGQADDEFSRDINTSIHQYRDTRGPVMGLL